MQVPRHDRAAGRIREFPALSPKTVSGGNISEKPAEHRSKKLCRPHLAGEGKTAAGAFGSPAKGYRQEWRVCLSKGKTPGMKTAFPIQK